MLSFCHLSALPARIFPRAMTANSRFSTWTTLPRAKYSMVSVSAAFVLFMVILLLFETYADTSILSPGTKPPRSSVTLHLITPPPTHDTPTRCSTSHLNGFYMMCNTNSMPRKGREEKKRKKKKINKTKQYTANENLIPRDRVSCFSSHFARS